MTFQAANERVLAVTSEHELSSNTADFQPRREQTKGFDCEAEISTP